MKASPLISTKRLQIEKSKRTILAAVIVASVVASMSIVTTKFLWDLGRHYSQVIGQKEAARDTLKTNLANAQQLKEKFNQFDNASDQITAQTVLDALPSKYDYPALVTSIDALAKRSGVGVDSINGEDLGDSALSSDTNPQAVAMPINITVVGTYEDLETFVTNLGRSIRPFTIKTIEIRGSDQIITADIAMETYYQPSVNLDVIKEAVGP